MTINSPHTYPNEHGPLVGRFAPSPSGRMHLGNVFASLVAWLSARSQGGRVVLRIEDLDPRSQSGPWAEFLMQDLQWLGLEWDKGPYYQTDRTELYQEACKKLTEQGLTYPCFCTRAELHAASAPHASDGTPIYAGTCKGLTPQEVAKRSKTRKPATRLQVPSKGTIYEFNDRVYGPYQEDLAQECGDFLIQRSDGVYAYQLAVVVDDAAMGITEVVRGCDLLSSTPRQMYLQDLLGLPHPSYAHVPLLLSSDGRRLSKRDQDVAMDELKEHFGSPEKLLGWLAGSTGLAPSKAPRTATQLAETFNWQAIRKHRDNMRLEL